MSNTMSFYDFSNPAVKPTTPIRDAADKSDIPAGPQPTIGEEVNRVMGQLGSFWGGVREQSATAFTSAKGGLEQVVVQAQEQVKKLSVQTEGSPSAATGEAGPSTPRGSIDKGKGPETPPRRLSLDSLGGTSPSLDAFLGRIRSGLPAPESITQTFQSLQERVQPALTSASTAASQAAAQAQVGVQGFGTTVATNFQRLGESPVVQEAGKQLGEYKRKSGAFLSDATVYIKDAVKVVPPGDNTNAGLMWDGSDLWMIPSGPSTSSDVKATSSYVPSPIKTTRADALLHRLRGDPQILRLDPTTEPLTKARYERFVAEEVTGKSDAWSKQIQEATDDQSEGGVALGQTRDTLVPAELASDEFWQRYFFRRIQIQEDEEKRKTLLESAPQKEEVIAWDDDSDDETKATDKKAAGEAKVAKPAAAPVQEEEDEDEEEEDDDDEEEEDDDEEEEEEEEVKAPAKPVRK